MSQDPIGFRALLCVDVSAWFSGWRLILGQKRQALGTGVALLAAFLVL